MLSFNVLGCALILCVVVFSWRRFTSPLWVVPGPFLSRFTSVPLRWHDFRANRTPYIHKLHLTYGPAVLIAPNEVSFTSFEAVKEIYGSSGSGYEKSNFYNLFTVFGRRTMFSTLDKTSASAFTHWVFAFNKYANSNVMKPASLSGIQNLVTEFARQCEDGATSVDIYIKGRLLILHAPTIYRYASKIINLFFEARATPLADAFVLQRSRYPDTAEFTLLSRLREKLGDQLTEIDVSAECLDHMVAGIDTTGDVLCFLMWELSQPRSEHHQARLREELLRNPTEAFDKLPYLDSVVQEGLRCFPAIPMSLPRVVPDGGRVIDNVQVPGGTIVSCQAHSVQRHNEHVFPDPDRFDPGRWMSSKGADERKRHIFAFSYGGRGCVGKHLAVAEMKLLLREVYSRLQSIPDPTMSDDSMRSHDQIISARPYGQKCLLHFMRASESNCP
ncbi:hypothetical protein PFICI_06682 [Pestalotiopsis fici W106-1]|uniref:Cytochrome P450 n=1 Tax=Pestalotiopsis fici (strain W106-1 / CGMCC3.15140) TaxID=1229662 RepID=W3X6L1_PESFW|nr:uncharacterized protein PFICI_06682 [Pestalotiopsis fici W106-1]ETS81680.1 hypothetical protein PFICI_06682 [Pestalotiopsis fici W106-1]